MICIGFKGSNIEGHNNGSGNNLMEFLFSANC